MVPGLPPKPKQKPAKDAGKLPDGVRVGTGTGQGVPQPHVPMPRCQDFQLLGYTPAEAHFGRTSYIDYYVRDPISGAKTRRRIKLDHIGDVNLRKSHARRLVAEINTRLSRGWNPLVQGENGRAMTTMNDALDMYLRVKVRDTRHRSPLHYSSHVRILKRWLDQQGLLHKYVNEFTKADAYLWMDSLEVKPNTWRNYRTRSAVMFRWMQERGMRGDNPFAEMRSKRRERKMRVRILPEQRAQAIAWFEANDPPMVLVCACVFSLMIRPRSEMLRLLVKDFDLDRGLVTIDAAQSKVASGKVVAIPRQALDLLRASAIAKSAPEHYAFGFGLIPGPRKSGHNAPGDRWARMRASLGWPREMQLYSLKDVGIEELAAKTSVIHAMKQARHESIETTHRYVEHEYAEWERQAVRDRAPSL